MSEQQPQSLDRHKIVLLPLNETYHRNGMSKQALYEATRGVWKIDKRWLDQIEYAFGVFERKIVSVYKPYPDKWNPGGTASYRTRPSAHTNNPKRWEFTAPIDPPPEIERSCLHKSVDKCLPRQHRQPAYRIMKSLPPGRSAAFLITPEKW